MRAPDDIRCTILMNLEVHDELPPRPKFSLDFWRRYSSQKTSVDFNNSSGLYQNFSLDYSTIPDIIAATEKFTKDSRTFFAERDRKPWIRHGSRLSFQVWVGPASEFEGKPGLPACSFTVLDALTAARLEQELKPYTTKDELDRAQAIIDHEASMEELAANATVLADDMTVGRPLSFRPKKKSISLYRLRNKSL